MLEAPELACLAERDTAGQGLGEQVSAFPPRGRYDSHTYRFCELPGFRHPQNRKTEFRLN